MHYYEICMFRTNLRVMLLFSYLITATVTLSLLLSFRLLKKKNKSTSKFEKILMYVLAGVFFLRFMWRKDSLSDSYMLHSNNFDSEFLNAYSIIVTWFTYASTLILILYPFFEIRGKNVLVKYFVLPMSIISSASFFILGIAIDGRLAFETFNLRMLIMACEFGLTLSLGIIVFCSNGFFKSNKSELKILWYLPLLLLATMPPYVLQGLFGRVKYSVELKSFKLPHRIILYFAFIIPVALYLLFRKKDQETKRAVLLYISLGTLMSFSVGYKFPDFLDITHWPFHLCNTAMYIVAICLIFKWNKLFYFTYFINVLGALLAMLMPNYSSSSNLFDSSLVNFYINHYIAFFMPLLIVALGVYARPKLKEFIYSMIGFLVYFVLVLILNAWFSNYGNVDYFFVNSDFIADKLGAWCEKLRDNHIWHFTIGELNFTFYPVYQLLFFLVYVALGAGVWFVYEGAYSFVDTIYDILARKEKIKLDKIALEISLNGRGIDEPMNKTNKNKLVLNNFSKRYGKSDVYAVKDASLEINGGEIFGFLGSNGAGKSTIIKSIVGIQPITSGSIEVCGYDVDKQSVMAKKNIGFVPDHYALYEKLTGREYINYIADLYDVSLEDRTKSINKYVDLFELNDAFDNQIKTYSHGMKQKIAIMSALVHNPKVWILDEPLTGLDPNSIYQVKVCMKEHAKKGNIVFFSSHLIDIVEQLCDRIAIIKKGKILTVQNVEDIEKECSLEEYYLKVASQKVMPTKVKPESNTSTTEPKPNKNN